MNRDETFDDDVFMHLRSPSLKRFMQGLSPRLEHSESNLLKNVSDEIRFYAYTLQLS